MLDYGNGAALIVFIAVIVAIYLSRTFGTQVVWAIACLLGIIYTIIVCKGEHK